MNIGAALAIRIDNLLIEKKLTKYALSKKATINESVLYHLRTGNTKSLNVTTLFLICDAFGITIQEFFDSPLFAKENLDY